MLSVPLNPQQGLLRPPQYQEKGKDGSSQPTKHDLNEWHHSCLPFPSSSLSAAPVPAFQAQITFPSSAVQAELGFQLRGLHQRCRSFGIICISGSAFMCCTGGSSAALENTAQSPSQLLSPLLALNPFQSCSENLPEINFFDAACQGNM